MSLEINDLKILLWAFTLECGFGSTKKISNFIKTNFLDTSEQRRWLENNVSSKNIILAEAELKQSVKENIKTISVYEQDFPPALKQISDPPLLLFIKGELPQTKNIAIVGSRKCSEYGKIVASKSSHLCTQLGFSVTSGLAFGIDSIAHKAAIEASNSNLTTLRHPGIAVLGTGLMNVYPSQNKQLANLLIDSGGCLISEFGLNLAARKYHFPRRNRVISGLSDYVMVIEARKKSGSLITAQFALEQNKQVLAVPGQITSSLSAGSNQLIAEGAMVIDSMKTLEFIIKSDNTATYKPSKASGLSSKLFEILKERGELEFAEAQQLLGISHPKARAEVAKLELNGLARVTSELKMYLNN